MNTSHSMLILLQENQTDGLEVNGHRMYFDLDYHEVQLFVFIHLNGREI